MRSRLTLSFLTILIVATHLAAATVTDLDGGFTVSGGYSYYYDPQQGFVTGANFNNLHDPLDVAIDSPTHQFIVRTTPVVTLSLSQAAAEFSTDTKVLMAGDDPYFSYLSGLVTQELRLQLSDAEAQGLYDQYFAEYGMLPLLKTAFDWSVHGELAPGDRLSFSLNNFVSGSTALRDIHGDLLRFDYATDIQNTTDSVQSFSFEYHFLSAPWGGTSNSLIFDQGAGFSWSIERATPGSGTSWIGFSDPGVSTEVITAVPEPSLLISAGCFACGSLMARSLFSRRRREIKVNIARVAAA